MDGIKLFAQQLNHGQSQIWLGTDDKETSDRRTLATNEVRNVVLKLYPEGFEQFYKDWHVTVGSIGALETANLQEIAKALRLS